jgi:hypothetical protein
VETNAFLCILNRKRSGFDRVISYWTLAVSGGQMMSNGLTRQATLMDQWFPAIFVDLCICQVFKPSIHRISCVVGEILLGTASKPFV